MMRRIHDREKLYSRPDLKARGWTDTLIDRHLPEPDDYRDNPHYKCAGPMKMWLRRRVHCAERRKAVVAHMEKRRLADAA